MRATSSSPARGFVILALFVAVIVWGKSHSLMAGILSFGVVLVGIEALLIIPGLLRRRGFARSDIADVDSMTWSGFIHRPASGRR